jgi:hypothetical protein
MSHALERYQLPGEEGQADRVAVEYDPTNPTEQHSVYINPPSGKLWELPTLEQLHDPLGTDNRFPETNRPHVLAETVEITLPEAPAPGPQA